MIHYSTLDITPKTRDWIEVYTEATDPLIKEYGGEYIAKTVNHERVEGKALRGEPTIRVIIKWPSREAAIGFMNDPRYAPHLKARTEGAICNHYLIEGIDEHTN